VRSNTVNQSVQLLAAPLAPVAPLIGGVRNEPFLLFSGARATQRAVQLPRLAGAPWAGERLIDAAAAATATTTPVFGYF